MGNVTANHKEPFNRTESWMLLAQYIAMVEGDLPNFFQCKSVYKKATGFPIYSITKSKVHKRFESETSDMIMERSCLVFHPWRVYGKQYVMPYAIAAAARTPEGRALFDPSASSKDIRSFLSFEFNQVEEQNIPKHRVKQYLQATSDTFVIATAENLDRILKNNVDDIRPIRADPK